MVTTTTRSTTTATPLLSMTATTATTTAVEEMKIIDTSLIIDISYELDEKPDVPRYFTTLDLNGSPRMYLGLLMLKNRFDLHENLTNEDMINTRLQSIEKMFLAVRKNIRDRVLREYYTEDKDKIYANMADDAVDICNLCLKYLPQVLQEKIIKTFFCIPKSTNVYELQDSYCEICKTTNTDFYSSGLIINEDICDDYLIV